MDRACAQIMKQESIASTGDGTGSILGTMDSSIMRPRRVESTVTETEIIPDYTTDPRERLSFLISSLFSALLEDTITEFRILEECNNEAKIMKTYADIQHLKTVKYGVVKPPSDDELEGINEKQLNFDIYKIQKLDEDRKFVINVIQSSYLEMAIRHKFDTLLTNNESTILRMNYRYDLEEEEARNKLIRRDLSKQVRQQRNRFKSVIYETDVKIDMLKSDVEDSGLVTEIKSRYIDNWEVARSEQNIEIINQKEVQPLKNIALYKQRLDHEHRVHSEVEVLVNIIINETLQKVEDWMEKYDRDIEKMDLKIQLKKNDLQLKYEEKVAMEELLEKHEQEMKGWVQFKDEREKARLYREKMNNAAVCVQAWWRGLLVRLQLGPFKPKGKPKGPQSKAGKKK